MLPGRQETRTSRSTISRMPEASLTPIDSPTWWMATETWMARSIATSCRSTWMRFSETGSNCMSRMIAILPSLPPSKVTRNSWVLPSWPWISRRMSFGVTATFTGAAPP